MFYADGSAWEPSRYFVYLSTWCDTSCHGQYDPTAISAANGSIRVRLATINGKPRVAAFVPLLPGAVSDRGDVSSMRYSFRIRADWMPGYKGVPLLWPIAGHRWPEWGELNWPESDFDRKPSGFMHRQGATVGNDQDWVGSLAGTTWQDWHTYTLEWVAGDHATYSQDGVTLARFTDRVPAGPMHLVMQFETTLAGFVPDPSVAGYVEIDWLRVEVIR